MIKWAENQNIYSLNSCIKIHISPTICGFQIMLMYEQTVYEWNVKAVCV